MSISWFLSLRAWFSSGESQGSSPKMCSSWAYSIQNRTFRHWIKKRGELPESIQKQAKYQLFGDLFSELIGAYTFSLLKEATEIGVA